MNKKDECEIVKDLAISYEEELLNERSKNFIEKHLNTCEECNKYYTNIKSEIYKEDVKEKRNDDIVVSQFKKINRHINILKSSLIFILIIIVIASLVFYIKGQKIANIIGKAYQKIETMRELDNYKLTIKTIQKKYDVDGQWEYIQNYYYKDGKYKIETNDSIKFYEDNSYEKTCVYNDLKQIDHYKQNFIEERKGRIFDIFSEIINYKTITNRIYNLTLSVREDNYNGIDCYVIRFGNDNNYRDTWINKNSFVTIRVVNKDYTNSYREEIYQFYENVVNDEDVDITILNSDKYKDYIKKDIMNNETEEIKLYYELYNKNY